MLLGLDGKHGVCGKEEMKLLARRAFLFWRRESGKGLVVFSARFRNEGSIILRNAIVKGTKER